MNTVSLIALAGVVSVLISAPAQAAGPKDRAARASACYTIINPDSRSACLAKAHGDAGRCYSVFDAEKRAQCLAEVRK